MGGRPQDSGGLGGRRRRGRAEPYAARDGAGEPSWEQYYAFARFHLQIKAREFFALTPRLFRLLVEQWRRQRRYEVEMLAVLRADVINGGMRGPREPVSYQDLLPPEPPRSGAPQRRPRPRGRSRQQIETGLRALMRAMAARGAPTTPRAHG